MALYKSFFCPIGNTLCQCCTRKFLKNNLTTFNNKKFNFKEDYFSTSIVRETRKHFNNLKPFEANSELKNLQNPTNSFSLLYKPFLFTIFFSSASIAGTAIWQYENIRKKALSLLQKSWFPHMPNQRKKYKWRQELNKLWNKLTEGQKLFAPICLINVVVFLAWKVKRFQPAMIKYFCSSPFNGVVCWPMILTAFSHYSFLHLVANMYVLYSFSTSGVEDLGKEQFLALYLAGGVISSFSSYLYKVIKSKHTLSLGASGAIMAMVSYICLKYPDAKLSIILLPWIVFSAGTGIKVIMSLDFMGAIKGWSYFDHAAHLGGSLCGLGWCYWGNTYIWKNREPLLEWWHGLRSPK